MLAVEPTMDGDFPPHELPPPGGGIQLQNRLLHCPWWGSFSPSLYPTFSSENQQFVGSTPFLGGQSCPETSYPTTATVPSFFSKSSDFPQVMATLVPTAWGPELSLWPLVFSGAD
ncbi:protein strawberry notch homolog 2 isoform 4 [Mus musculus]|uniref:protein strawberry notch homolog 2 isoform 4 n=1 Tax=Mus musculus TaxID=10090 RepID=UPI000C80E5FC|nr:protein strawberry notch homolog 2 isoform 4 [Mus musculus]